MEYLRQTISSARLSGIFDLPPELRDKNVEVIILPVQSDNVVRTSAKRQFGFAPGAEIPDSFFEPLPEEEL